MTISNCEFIFIPFCFCFVLVITLTDDLLRCLLYHGSSQFDPAPRDETWHKSPRTPDYFL